MAGRWQRHACAPQSMATHAPGTPGVLTPATPPVAPWLSHTCAVACLSAGLQQLKLRVQRYHKVVPLAPPAAAAEIINTRRMAAAHKTPAARCKS